jgi:F-type H+-transporting ATPase subunit b
MLIDWFTVAAQIVNFLVLVALLRHFLYGPIIRSMDRREEQVVSRIREAENKVQEAEDEKQLFLDRQKKFDQEREEMLARSREEAEELHRKLTTEVRQEISQSRERWQAALEMERETFLKELRQRAGLQVYAVAAKALGDLADVSLESKLISRFMENLESLDQESRHRLKDSNNKGFLVIISAFELPDEERQRLAGRLREFFGTRVDPQFEVHPGLICGVKLKAHGCETVWSLENYLLEMEQEMSRALSEEG